MRLPFSAGVISDATKIKVSGLCEDLFELIPITRITDAFTSLDNWTETDGTGKVNIVAGGLEMDGANSVGSHGVRLTQSLSRKITKITTVCRVAGAVVGGVELFVKNTTGLPSAPTATGQVRMIWGVSNDIKVWDGQASAATGQNVGTYAINTDYTVNFYIYKGIDTTWSKLVITILGGIYTAETTLFTSEKILTELATSWYFGMQRFSSNAGTKALYKSFVLAYDYATDAPYVDFVSDAGASKLHYGVDFTNLALPTNIASTNLEFAYSYDDGVASYSGKYTLANLKALGAISGNKRYLRIRVYANSNGETQTYIAPINANDAVATIGNVSSITPVITSVTPRVVTTSAGTELTIALTGGGTGTTSVTLGGTACTDIVVDSDTSVRAKVPAKTASTYDVVLTSPSGTAIATNAITVQAGASAPSAFTLSAIEWGANRARLSWTPSAGAMSFGVYRDTVLIATVTDNFFYIDKPTAGTISYYVKATNSTGSTDSNTVSIDIGLGGIERRAWTYFKSTMQADSDLSAYIAKWKFNKTEEQFTPALCPLFVAYVEGVEQGAYMGVPKQRTDTVLIKVSGKVASEGDNADNELLKIDEMIRNALEKTLQLAPAWFTVTFGNSSFVWLNDRIQEVNIDVRLALPRFTSGTR